MRTKKWMLIVIVIALLAIGIASKYTEIVHAATHSSRTFVFDGSYTDAYIILFERNTGNLVNATTGEPASTVTWAQAKIDAAQHAQSDVWVATIPALLLGPEYTVYILDDYASAAKTQTASKAFYYDPRSDRAISYTVETN